ncbi:aminotransferase class V-fold PLP-dependent enzyme [Bowmanella sp. JS7-9]|uniref:cysteine desulfurase n=1 Tax=Pseudobowmanella zhangzhouensis TaxID=1537679 RepID=A0ABW1XKB6_9ALTE|nr:aminotransferase class V-fold PLP-dependent enzyme [Bowmanella sp. JS7-9]TBX27476.1 hypothetical protein TK45_01700 [Bowmanella sp. JS7-9]
MSHLRTQFPFFRQHPELVYFDSAATAQVPQTVVDAITDYYIRAKVNVHRSGYRLASQLTDRFEQVRSDVATYINAPSARQIVFTYGTTDGFNLLAQALSSRLKAGDEIILTEAEHHANLVPWQQLAHKLGLVLRWIPVDKHGAIQWQQLDSLLSQRTRLVCFAHASNTLGAYAPIKTLVAKIHAVGALCIVDGAQAIAHCQVDVQAMDCDAYLFSGHKLYGPTGVGVLYAREGLLDDAAVYRSGGEMVQQVAKSHSEFQPMPLKYEAGTPNISAVLGLGAAIAWCRDNLTDAIFAHEQQIYRDLRQGLSARAGIELVGEDTDGVPLILFKSAQLHPQDLALALDAQNICVRTGKHCAMVLHDALHSDGLVRLSVAAYNNRQDVERFFSALDRALTIEDDDMALPTAQLPELDELRSAKGWENKYRQIMLLGKQLPKIPTEQQSPDSLIEGCESPVYLLAAERSGRWQFQADSPSKIIRGLLMVILLPLQQQPREAINEFDVDAYLHELGVAHFLSQSRQNGLRAVIERLKTLSGLS